MSKPTDEQIIADCEKNIAELGPPRCAFIAAALALRDLTWENAATRDKYVEKLYLENVFPVRADGTYEATPQQLTSARAMAAAQSTCGITTRAIWRAVGVDAPQVYDFYGNSNRIGSAIGYEINFAKQVGAWVSAIPWVEGTPFPLEGDALTVGLKGNDGYARGDTVNVEHEFTVISWLDGFLHGMDGGQPGIHIRTRRLLEVWTGKNTDGKQTGELWVGKVNPDGNCPVGADGRPATGRRVLGFVNMDKVPYRAGKPPPCKGGGGGVLGSFFGGGIVGQIVSGVAIGVAALGVGAGVAWLIDD